MAVPLGSWEMGEQFPRGALRHYHKRREKGVLGLQDDASPTLSPYL